MEQHEHHEHNQGSEKLFDPEPEQLLHDQPTASMQRKDGEGAVPGDRGKREVKPGVCFCVQRSAYPLGGGPSVSLHRLAVTTHDCSLGDELELGIGNYKRVTLAPG